MQALVLATPAPIESAPLRRETRSIPAPDADEILVRVDACGICRTDLHIVEGELPLVRAPIVPGHQVVGRVESVGARARRFRPASAWASRGFAGRAVPAIRAGARGRT